MSSTGTQFTTSRAAMKDARHYGKKDRIMNVKTRYSMMVSLVGLIVLIFASGYAGAEETDPGYAKRGEKACFKCHNDDESPVAKFLKTPHAQRADGRTPFAAHDCESCHGASPEHMKKVEESEVRPLPAVVFGANSATPVDQQNEVCLGCHEGGVRMNWTGSQHQAADTSCASCHDVHAARDSILVKKTQPEVCYTCHVEQRADSHRRSTHPIKEGKVTCSDCHNPHGSAGPKLLKEISVNDTCYGCHAEKRGPFLWEHAPVRDDCSSCHTPHGSNLTRLLKARTPYLCQECHQENYHPGTLYSGTGLAGASPNARVLGKDCMNCHPKVHGSNHPSGTRLTR